MVDFPGIFLKKSTFRGSFFGYLFQGSFSGPFYRVPSLIKKIEEKHLQACVLLLYFPRDFLPYDQPGRSNRLNEGLSMIHIEFNISTRTRVLTYCIIRKLIQAKKIFLLDTYTIFYCIGLGRIYCVFFPFFCFSEIGEKVWALLSSFISLEETSH